MSNDSSGTEREYYVVHDGGHGDGMIEEGPFPDPMKAVKAKNRLNRKSHHMCDFRVQEVFNNRSVDTDTEGDRDV